ncbi:MAG: HNH endonuclease signature motif containing protein [Candidatus ainarchaeum sp.]|nr:HNH endonuclease signature motif containing protein [Candidatus ainarchaeum sp.]
MAFRLANGREEGGKGPNNAFFGIPLSACGQREGDGRNAGSELVEGERIRRQLSKAETGRRADAEAREKAASFNPVIGKSLMEAVRGNGLPLEQVFSYRFTNRELKRITECAPGCVPRILSSIEELLGEGLELDDARAVAVAAPYGVAAAIAGADSLVGDYPFLSRRNALLISISSPDPEADASIAAGWAARLMPLGIISGQDVYSIAANQPHYYPNALHSLEQATLKAERKKTRRGLRNGGFGAEEDEKMDRHVIANAARILAESPHFDLIEAFNFASRPSGLDVARLVPLILRETPAWSGNECKLLAYCHPLDWGRLVPEADFAKLENADLSEYECKRLVALHGTRWRGFLADEMRRQRALHPELANGKLKKVSIHADQLVVHGLLRVSDHFRAVRKVSNNNHRAARKEAEGEHTVEEWIKVRNKAHGTCPGWKCGPHREGIPELTEDHVIPLDPGLPFAGTNYIENIQPLCARCNSSKGNTPGWGEVYRRVESGVPLERMTSNPALMLELLKKFAETNGLESPETLPGARNRAGVTCRKG